MGVRGREERSDAQLRVIVEGRCGCWMCKNGESPEELPGSDAPISIGGELVINSAYDVTWSRQPVDVDKQGDLFALGDASGVGVRPVWLMGRVEQRQLGRRQA